MSPDQSVIVVTLLLLAAGLGITVSAFSVTAARWTWRALAAALVLAVVQRLLELVDRLYYSGLNPADHIEDWVVLLTSAAVLASVALGRRESALRRREREELARRERHLATLFATMPGPLVLIAPDGSLRDVNQAVLAMAGLDRTALLGQPAIDFLVVPEHRGAAGQALDRAVAGQVITGLELAVQVPGGSRRTIVWNAAAMPQGQPQPGGARHA